MTKTISVKEAIANYMDVLKEAGKSERTLYTYGKDFEQVMAFFGADRPLNSILLTQVGKFYRSDVLLKLPNGQERAFKTVDKTRRVFRMFLVWAYQQGYIETLPLPKSTPMGRDKDKLN